MTTIVDRLRNKRSEAFKAGSVSFPELSAEQWKQLEEWLWTTAPWGAADPKAPELDRLEHDFKAAFAQRILRERP